MALHTPAELLTRLAAADPARPLLTQYDHRTGDRVELSARTLENWQAKTANLLLDTGMGPGSAAAVLIGPHWQAAGVALGCWAAGVSVLTTAGPADVVFAEPDRFTDALGLRADETYGVSLSPLGAPLGAAAPAGITDYAVDVRAHGDRFSPYPAGDGPALDDLDHTALAAMATGRAAAMRGRTLIPVPDDSPPALLDWLVAPLTAGVGIVLVRHPDETRLADVSATEGLTGQS